MRKAIIVTLASILVNTSLAAQTTTQISITASIEQHNVKELTKPRIYNEPGTVIVNVLVGKGGDVLSARVDTMNTTMKDKSLLSSFLTAAYLSTFTNNENAPDSLKGNIKYEISALSQSQIDNLQTEIFNSIEQKVGAILNQGRFILYPTENMWTFLELDTCTGAIWKVQYTTNNDEEYRFKTLISSKDLREDYWGNIKDEYIPGRFQLYKTQNMYNFILVDTTNGRTWQVQWSMKPQERFVKEIR